MDISSIERFSLLFRGNKRSYGVFDQNKTKNQVRTELKQYNEEHFRAHLNGEMGVGIVPIRDDGTCYWGAIDIDNHGSSVDLDLTSIEAKVVNAQLPLMVCRSKSGGAHLYIFFAEPIKAVVVRSLLTRWMADLNIEGSDCVFPKQTKLVLDNEGKMALGNWINLPYFDAENTKRYAVSSGKPMPFEMFLTSAESKQLLSEQVEKLFSNEHGDAPPCIRKALEEKIGRGARNEALFHITVYNRKRSPDQARELSHQMQARLFDEPLSFPEADRVIRSANKKSYGYLCKKQPWAAWCDRDACKKCKYGISESEFETLNADSMLPVFSDLVKFTNTDPTLWELRMNGTKITFTTVELMDLRIVRERALEKLHVILPSKIKPNQWVDEILSGLMDTLRIEEAPKESSLAGVLQLRLEEFTSRADLDSDGADPKDRESLLRGMPVVQLHKGSRVVMFRPIDYEDYLKRQRTDLPRNKGLWYKMNREMGIEFDRVRVKSQLVSVWCVGIPEQLKEEDNVTKFNPEY